MHVHPTPTAHRLVLLAVSVAVLTGQGAFGGLAFPEIAETLKDWENAHAQLAVQKENRELFESLDRVLTLGSDCRWSDCAKEVRALLDKHRERARRTPRHFSALLFALEYAATVSRDDVQKIFSTQDAEFNPASGKLVLGYHDAVPAAWELEGTRVQGSGTLDLSGGKTVTVTVPFRRTGGPRYHGSRQAIEAPSLGLGRMVMLKKGSTVEAGWATLDETGTRVHVAYVLERLATGAAQAHTELRVDHKTKSRRSPLRVGSGAFVNLGDLSAQIEARDIVFALGGTYRQRAAIPGAGPFRLTLKGDGAGVQFDWFRVGGAVEGLWLSRQLVLRMKTRAEAFVKDWNDPLPAPAAAQPPAPGGTDA